MSVGDGQRLRAFRLVCDLGSISAAADVLGYTQSAVSQQLAALEREAGVALVDRTQRPLRPTPAGAALRPSVEGALAAIAGVEAALEDVRGGTRRIRLAAFTSALSSFVPAAVRDLRRAHPDVVVHVLQLETPAAVEQLRGGDVDLAIVHHLPGAGVPETAGLQRRRLLVDELYVVLPAGHRLSRREAISVAELDGEPLILPRRDAPAGRFRALVEHLFAQAGVVATVAYELDDLPAAQAFVATGIALVPMHGLTLATVPPGVSVRPLADAGAASRTVEALAPGAARTPVAEELLDRLATAARAYGSAGELRRPPRRRQPLRDLPG